MGVRRGLLRDGCFRGTARSPVREQEMPGCKPTSGDLSGQPAHPFVRVADFSSPIMRTYVK